MALANAPSKAVADQCPVVKTRKRNRRRVLTWFAGRWRSHQPKRAEKPHSKFNLARGWTALPRGRRLRLPRRMASGSRQPPRGERQMSAREREPGELPPPDLSPSGRKAGRGLFVFLPVAGSPRRSLYGPTLWPGAGRRPEPQREEFVNASRRRRLGPPLRTQAAGIGNSFPTKRLALVLVSRQNSINA